MRKHRLTRAAVLLAAGFFLTLPGVRAQQPETQSKQEDKPPPAIQRPVEGCKPHRFADRTNLGLFAGVATIRALDYTSTRHFRARGGDEVLLTNAVVDNKPAFATIEAAGTAASIALSYWLHRKGHHTLERWISITHIGVGGFGVIHNYTIKRTKKTVP